MDAKGLDLVRRDRIPLARELQKTILDKILFEKDLQGAVRACRQTAEDLLAGRIGLEKLTLSQQLKSIYANDAHAHLMVAKKIRERMPGSEPKPGDRVPYVFIDIGDDKANSSAMAEDPAYALEQNLPINYYLYLRSHLINPLSTILDLFVKHGGKAEDILFADIIREYKNRKNSQRQISSFFQPVVKKPKKEQWNNM